MITVDDAKTKIVNCVLSSENDAQLDTCQRMLDNFTCKYVPLIGSHVMQDVANMETLIELKRKGAAIPGCCEKCGEPINNAEYTICQQCRAEVMEYQRDVQEELGRC